MSRGGRGGALRRITAGAHVTALRARAMTVTFGHAVKRRSQPPATYSTANRFQVALGGGPPVFQRTCGALCGRPKVAGVQQAGAGGPRPKKRPHPFSGKKNGATGAAPVSLALKNVFSFRHKQGFRRRMHPLVPRANLPPGLRWGLLRPFALPRRAAAQRPGGRRSAW